LLSSGHGWGHGSGTRHLGDGLSGATPIVDLVPKKYRDVRKALLDAGWEPVRMRGSHEVWAHPDREARIDVAGKDSDTVPVGTLGSIRKASGLKDLR
jgi:predicted RNA binding protein YcfA (HicA-like mRNA interferase family)